MMDSEVNAGTECVYVMRCVWHVRLFGVSYGSVHYTSRRTRQPPMRRKRGGKRGEVKKKSRRKYTHGNVCYEACVCVCVYVCGA